MKTRVLNQIEQISSEYGSYNKISCSSDGTELKRYGRGYQLLQSEDNLAYANWHISLNCWQDISNTNISSTDMYFPNVGGRYLSGLLLTQFNQSRFVLNYQCCWDRIGMTVRTPQKAVSFHMHIVYHIMTDLHIWRSTLFDTGYSWPCCNSDSITKFDDTHHTFPKTKLNPISCIEWIFFHQIQAEAFSLL